MGDSWKLSARGQILQQIQEERQKRENDTLLSSRERQDEIVSNIQQLMQEHGERVPEMLKHEQDLQTQELQRIAEQPMYADSMEEHEKILSELKASQDEQQSILQSIAEKASSGQTQKLQDLAERDLLRKSWARQDKILAQIAEKRRAKRAAEVKPAEVTVKPQDIEWQIRALAKREQLAGRLSSNAAASRDKPAWDRAQAIMDKLANEREGLFQRLKKVDPKRADALYDDVYIKNW